MHGVRRLRYDAVGAVVASLTKSQTACVNHATSESQMMRRTLNKAEWVEIPAAKQIVPFISASIQVLFDPRRF
jgi:hypothetical protein